MTEINRHDWPQIIREIIAAYGLIHKKTLTPYKLGLMVAGTDKKIVKGWMQGNEPGHFKGQLLLAYHAEFHRETGENFPTPI